MWTECNSKFKKQQDGFRRKGALTTTLFKTIKFGFHDGHPTTDIFLDVQKTLHQARLDGLLFKITTVGLHRKLIRSVINFVYQRELIILINNQLSSPITPINGIPQGSLLSLILLILYVSVIPQPTDAQVNLFQFADDFANWAQASGNCIINIDCKNNQTKF